MSDRTPVSPHPAVTSPSESGFSVRARRRRLRIWHKLAVIALAFLMPLALAATYVIGQQNASTAVSQQELNGVRYLRPLTTLTFDLLQYRTLSNRQTNGIPTSPHQFSAVSEALDRDFRRMKNSDSSIPKSLKKAADNGGKTQLALPALLQQWQGIKAIGSANAFSAGFTTQLIRNVLDLYAYLGDVSKINFDPGQDTLYTGAAMLKLQPQMVDEISRLGDAAGTALHNDTATGSGSLIQAAGLLGQLLGQLSDTLDRAFEGTTGNGDRLRTVLAPLLGQASTSANTLIGSTNQMVSGPPNPTQANVQNLTSGALSANRQLWDAMAGQEAHMLSARIDAAEQRSSILLATIGAGLALILTLTTLMSRSIARNVSSVVEAARALTAGNLDRRARVNSRDETATLAETFNAMADHLQESYAEVEEKVQVRTDELHQRTRSLNLLQGVATAANKATTWDEALASALPLICRQMSWPAAHSYTTASFSEPVAGEDDNLTASAVWYTRAAWPAEDRQVCADALQQPSAVVLRAHTSGKPQGPELLDKATAALLPEPETIVATVAFPVLVHRGRGGVVEFFTTDTQALSESVTALIAGLIGQLGRVREREMAAQALEEAAQAAEAANHAKSAFLATVSHEIRTPMNAVMGMTELLLDTPLVEEQKYFAEIVHNSADSLLTIINDILDLSKSEAGKLELEQAPVDLRDCIESAFDLIAPRAHEKPALDLAYIVDPGLPDMIMCDGLRLRQIIINLLGNAVKFTDSGEIVLTAAPDSTGPAGSELDEGNFTLRISVRDTGVGIPADRIGQLFQPFEQLDSSTTRRYGGTGLGLAISRHLVELMDGSIWAESELG
ncbi:ATP-binding protein, partial [Streptomyces sp. NPDC005534]